MIIGQTVFGGTYLSPWFPRQGDSAVFSAETLSTNGTLTFRMLSKNREEADSQAGTVSATSPDIFGSGASSAGTVSGTLLKELVRFQYFVSPANTNWVHFRVLPPAWRMNGA